MMATEKKEEIKLTDKDKAILEGASLGFLKAYEELKEKHEKDVEIHIEALTILKRSLEEAIKQLVEKEDKIRVLRGLLKANNICLLEDKEVLNDGK